MLQMDVLETLIAAFQGSVQIKVSYLIDFLQVSAEQMSSASILDELNMSNFTSAYSES